jgi:hypothetical protein
VRYPETMTPQFRSFLAGLLNKSPDRRLDWPHLADHPFVRGGVVSIPVEAVLEEPSLSRLYPQLPPPTPAPPLTTRPHAASPIPSAPASARSALTAVPPHAAAAQGVTASPRSALSAVPARVASPAPAEGAPSSRTPSRGASESPRAVAVAAVEARVTPQRPVPSPTGGAVRAGAPVSPIVPILRPGSALTCV